MNAKRLLFGALLLRSARKHIPENAPPVQNARQVSDERDEAIEKGQTTAARWSQQAERRRGLKGYLYLVKDAASEWAAAKAPRLGAALSYYTVFAIAPVLLVAISVAGLVLGAEAAQGRIIDELGALLGPDTAKLVQDMLAKSAQHKSGVIGTVVGVGTLLLGATAVMIEMEAALNAVWKVKPVPGRGIKGLIKDRLLSLGLVLSLGFLLMVSLVTSAALAAVGGFLESFSFPGAAIVGQVLNNAITLVVIGAFFALIFKYLPNTKIAWRDVWVGALVTSVLFHVGKIAIGIYLGRATIASTFGAAGSLAVLLVWIYYSSQIVLFGAVITKLYADRHGQGVEPDEDAIPVDNAAQCATNTT